MDKQVYLGKLPPKAREQFEKMIAEGKQIHIKTNKPLPVSQPLMPPLVKSVKPIGPELRGASIRIPKPESYTISVPMDKTQPESQSLPGVIEFTGFQSFYDFLLKYPEIYQGKEDIQAFVAFVENIPKSCGCVRGTLNEKASALYSQLLPSLDIKYPNTTQQIKTFSNSNKIFFKEGPVLLLEV